jgi:phosphatidylglycerol lysyltransferase
MQAKFAVYCVNSIYDVSQRANNFRCIMTLQFLSLRQSAINDEFARVQETVEKYGCTSLARFTLFADKSYFFSPNGSVIAFALKGRIALVLGDPIGPANDVEASILAFKDFCARNYWQACFYQVQQNYLDAYRSLGFNTISVGQEAIIDLAVITLQGRAGKKFRNAVNRLTHLEHCVEIYEPSLNDELFDELKIVSNEWLSKRIGNEVRFSVGWFHEEYIRHSTVAVVRTPKGHITAFANVVLDDQHRRITLDLMRHRYGIENCTMDFLFVSLLDWAKRTGYKTFSLGFSPLSGVGEKPHDSVMEKALRVLYENISRYPNLKGLHAFKNKFHPQWEPRYMVYPGAAHLPSIVVALFRAHYGY